MPKTEAKQPQSTEASSASGDTYVHEETGFYEAYAGFANNLRTWFIAYGIGGPVLSLSSEPVWKRVAATGDGSQIAGCFLAGVGIQLGAALMYKTAMWYLYTGERKHAFRRTRRYKVADFVSENYLIETCLDIGTLLLFLFATWKVFEAFTSGA